MVEKFMNDLAGNILAVIVLLGMFGSAMWIGYRFLQGDDGKGRWPRWAVPFLSILGLGVATYLTYIEVTQTQAICGPVGNCNAVQKSPYTYFFGVISIGILGVVGYITILLMWLIQSYGPASLRKASTLAIWGMAWFGTLFSIYLTFMEPFVIGATCIWCLSSAVLMTLVLWASTGPALSTWQVEPASN